MKKVLIDGSKLPSSHPYANYKHYSEDFLPTLFWVLLIGILLALPGCM